MTAALPRARRKGPAIFGLLLAVNVVAFTGVMTDQAGAVPTSPNLGTAANASVIAGSTVTNTGASVLGRDLDLAPGSSVTGFPPGLVLGATNVANGPALIAQADATAAYRTAKGAPSDHNETGLDLAGQTLLTGVYTASSGMALTGTLTLSGDPSSVFIFQAGSTLITGSGSSVVLTGGVQACNVWWQVSSSATLGTTNTFVGNILALTSIDLGTGTTIDGRAMAQTGAVTLHDNVFRTSACNSAPPVTTTTTTPATTTPATTTPATTTPATTTPTPTATTVPALSLPVAPLPYTNGPTTPTTGPAVVGPPRTGGAPLRHPTSPWLPVLVVSLLGSVAVASGLSLRAQRTPPSTGR